MAAILKDGELTLTGYVGLPSPEDGFDHADVVVALAQIDDTADLTIYLNSGGGDASDGSAIQALLSRREGKTDIVVDGVAASAASLIAMAGDTVTMSAGSIMMIHDPANISIGNSDDHAKNIEYLEALATSYARVYAAKSGKSVDEARAIMKAERWLSPDEAVAEGFADQTSEDQAKAVAAFDYRAYAHAPKRLTALASKKNWRLPDAKAAAKSALATRQQEEQSMTDKERADQLAAELDTLKAKAKKDADNLAQMQSDKQERERQDAIMALPEAEGRATAAKALAAAKGVTVDAAKSVLTATAKEDEGDAAAYETRRANAAGLTAPDTSKAKASSEKGAASMVANMQKLIKKETV